MTMRESPWYAENKQEGIQLGEKLGEQRGIQLGKQEGIQIGEQRTKRQTARNLLGMGLDLQQIAAATGLTLEQVRQLQSE